MQTAIGTTRRKLSIFAVMLVLSIGQSGKACAQSTDPNQSVETATGSNQHSPAVNKAADDRSDKPCSHNEQSEAHRRAGEMYLSSGFLVPALDEFRKSFALCSSQTMLFRIGFSELALRNYTRARKAFLSLDSTEIAVAAQLRNVNEKVGYVSLEVTPATATVLVDGRPLEKDAFTPPNRPNTWVAGIAETSTGTSPGAKFVLLADEGFHAITVTKPGYEKAQEQVYVVGGQSDKRKISLRKTEPNSSKFLFNTLPKIFVATGAGALLGAGAAAIVASEFEKKAQCDANRCIDRKAYESGATAADVVTGLGIASPLLVAAGAFLKYQALSQDQRSPGTNQAAQVFDVRVDVSPNAASLGVVYAF